MTQPSSSPLASLPLVLMGASLLVFFGWQIKESRQRGKALQQRITALQPAATRAQENTNILQNLAAQVAALAPEDKAAAAVVAKYRISVNNPQTPAIDPAASPEAAAAQGAETP